VWQASLLPSVVRLHFVPVQAARTLSGLYYGTRESAKQCQGNRNEVELDEVKCTMGTTQRQKTEVFCRGRLIRSSDEVSVMEMERRD
jgi:hypothetical protein